MNGFGIGSDIESIKRFKKLNPVGSRIFLNKIFTKNEIDYCYSKKVPAPHLAVRFSAKEAINKALNSIGRRGVSYKEIEVLNNKKGVPVVKIIRQGFDHLHFYISLSHCEDKALAFAIVAEKNDYEKDQRDDR